MCCGPRTGRGFCHAAEQALGQPGSQQHRPVRPDRHESGPTAQDAFPLRQLVRIGLLKPGGAGPARAHPGTKRAGRPFRRADARAQIHDGLREIAGTIGGHERLRPIPDNCFGGRERLLHPEQARHHPLDIAVDGCRHPIEGDRRNRGRRVGADPRQGAEAGLRVREATAMPRHDGLGAGMKVSGARVIAETGPGAHHSLARSVRERRHVRKPGQESRIERFHGRNRGLLQHDLR